MEKSNQLPKTEGCLAEGEPVEPWFYRVERPSGSVPRERREPQAGPASCLSNSASKELEASGQAVNLAEPETELTDKGEVREGLPGSKSVARIEGDARNEGGPESPCRTNCEGQAGRERKSKGAPPGLRESDWLIVASSKAQAPKLVKGPTARRSSHRQPMPYD